MYHCPVHTQARTAPKTVALQSLEDTTILTYKELDTLITERMLTFSKSATAIIQPVSDIKEQIIDILAALRSGKTLVFQSPYITDLPHIFDNGFQRVLFFTSGSTAEPKMITHRPQALMQAAEAQGTALRIGPGTHCIQTIQLWHVGGCMLLLRALLKGARLLITSTLRPLPYDLLARQLTRHPPCMLSLVPTALQKLLDHTAAQSGPLTATILLGGSSYPGSLIAQALKRGLQVYTSYGSTETAAFISISQQSLDYPELYVSSGKALDTCRIYTDANATIVVEAPWLSDGSARLRTSDAGHIDSAGNLFILNRTDRVIISGGENIPLARLEQQALNHPAVRQACAVGIDHATWGQRPVLFVTTGKKLPAAQLHEYLLKKIPREFMPYAIHLREQLPERGIGKTDYRALALAIFIHLCSPFLLHVQ